MRIVPSGQIVTSSERAAAPFPARVGTDRLGTGVPRSLAVSPAVRCDPFVHSRLAGGLAPPLELQVLPRDRGTACYDVYSRRLPALG